MNVIVCPDPVARHRIGRDHRRVTAAVRSGGPATAPTTTLMSKEFP
ncbi:hypothetical protein [Micromonospora sp. WMMD708]